MYIYIHYITRERRKKERMERRDLSSGRKRYERAASERTKKGKSSRFLYINISYIEKEERKKKKRSLRKEAYLFQNSN